jgi:hypothetical protein
MSLAVVEDGVSTDEASKNDDAGSFTTNSTAASAASYITSEVERDIYERFLFACYCGSKLSVDACIYHQAVRANTGSCDNLGDPDPSFGTSNMQTQFNTLFTSTISKLMKGRLICLANLAEGEKIPILNLGGYSLFRSMMKHEDIVSTRGQERRREIHT